MNSSEQCGSRNEGYQGEAGSPHIDVIQVEVDGTVIRRALHVVDLINLFIADDQGPESDFKRATSCYRDLMIFLQQTNLSTASDCLGPNLDASAGTNSRLPKIFPRSEMGYFMLDFFQLKLICWADRCLVLDTQRAFDKKNCLASNISNAIFIQNFVQELCKSFGKFSEEISDSVKSWNREVQNFQRQILRECSRVRLESDVVGGDVDEIPFEIVVLTSAFNVAIETFLRSVVKMRKISEILQKLVRARPTDRSLEKLLAFKKSIVNIEIRVFSFKRMIETLLSNDQHMADLYLTNGRRIQNHEEVELLLEGFQSDLQEILFDVQSMKSQIEDSRDFINTHQNESCNQIIGLSLHMMSMNLSVGFVAAITSFFGMNMLTGIEEDPVAFFITTPTLVLAGSIIFVLCVLKFRNITSASKTSGYPLLKDIQRYIDILELLNYSYGMNGPMKEDEARNLLSKLIRKPVSSEEFDLVIQTLNAAGEVTNFGQYNQYDFDDIIQNVQ